MSSEDFKSLIVTDPDLVDEGIDVSGLRTTTDTSPFLLGNIPDYSGIQYSTLAPTKYTDLMRLYSQGLPTIDTSQPATPPSGGGGGGGETLPGFNDPTPEPINTPEDQRLIDEGIGLQIEPGSPVFAPGEAPVTQEEIDAFNQIPVSTDYDVPDSSYDVAGLEVAENVPQAPEGGSPGILNPATYANTGNPDLLDLAGGEAGGPDGVGIIDEVEPYRDPIMDMVEQPQTDSILAGEAMGRANTGLEDDFLNLIGQEDAEIEDIPVELPATNIETAIDPQAVRTILGPDGITYDAVTGQPIYEDLDAQAAATDVVTEQDLADNTGLLQKLGLPADFDIKQAAIEAGINLAVGVPITLIAKGLGAVLPDRDPRQTALDEMYDVKDGTIQSGLMKGYNPVSGNPFNPTYGLQDAYQKRIDTINKTLGKMTLEQYQNTDLVQRKKDLEEAMAKEKAMLDQLQYGDPEKIAAGIETADDDSGSEMLDTSTPFDANTFDDDVTLTGTPPTGTITPLEDDFESLVEPIEPPMTLADDRLNKMTDDVDLDDFDTTPPAPPSSPTSTDRPGGDSRDDSPAPSAPKGTTSAPPGEKGGPGYVDPGPTPTQDFYQDPITTGGGGNQGDPGGSKGCVIATHAVNSGAFTKDTKREAVRWCVKNLHRTWWGEAVRKGYRYYGQKAIEQGKAKNHYQEFKDYVAFGTGKRRTLKTGWTFVYRTVQFFLKGLTL